ncbi:taste receptor type 2 member 117-like [Perognathus longimembris pacificus]|uniref:taste receptor type 2 member 117-like n=1 Tax=Perognathus longimembris pacificus TaxID=214514 RepID=UPI002018D81E|nr:taste receptor type 2 member 117-like [Perognathus longimembris pacificus]
MFLIILGLVFLVGNLGNGFIALVNGVDWVRRRKISFTDLILTTLAISRIGMLSSTFSSLLIGTLKPGLWNMEIISRTIILTWVVTNHFSIWLATSLSTFYFFKIANFSNSFFLYLKWRVQRVISLMILGSLVILCINGFLVNTAISEWIVESKRNASSISGSETSVPVFKRFFICIILFLCIPFAMSLIAFILLIFSLWTHYKKMQDCGRGLRDASTTAHVRALHTVIAFLILYSIFFFCLIILIWNYKFLETDRTIWPSEVAVIAFPSFHSYVLILGNSKLNWAFLDILQWLGFRPRDPGTPGPLR